MKSWRGLSATSIPLPLPKGHKLLPERRIQADGEMRGLGSGQVCQKIQSKPECRVNRGEVSLQAFGITLLSVCRGIKFITLITTNGSIRVNPLYTFYNYISIYCWSTKLCLILGTWPHKCDVKVGSSFLWWIIVAFKNWNIHECPSPPHPDILLAVEIMKCFTEICLTTVHWNMQYKINEKCSFSVMLKCESCTDSDVTVLDSYMLIFEICVSFLMNYFFKARHILNIEEVWSSSLRM